MRRLVMLAALLAVGCGFGEAGRSMLDWLRIFRLAAERADGRHVVLIPLID